MNAWQARESLNRRLKFADAEQIEAKHYLAHLAEVISRVMVCPLCLGEGVRQQGRRLWWNYCECVSMESDQVKCDLGISFAGRRALHEVVFDIKKIPEEGT
jgi:hypothetical protein